MEVALALATMEVAEGTVEHHKEAQVDATGAAA